MSRRTVVVPKILEQIVEVAKWGSQEQAENREAGRIVGVTVPRNLKDELHRALKNALETQVIVCSDVAQRLFGLCGIWCAADDQVCTRRG